jgi:hypothetical protein
MAAFPHHLFLFQFLQARNKDHRDPELIEKQLALLEEYDMVPPLPLPQTTPPPPQMTPPPPLVKAPHPAPIKTAPPPQPRPHPRAEVTEAPLPALLASVLPDPLPPCATGIARTTTGSGSGAAQLPAQPRVVACREPKRVVEVVMPPRPP